ncbi:MAG TPA: hypothetical protein VJC03_02070, partial [bacterium]|nr:hypothetical protein [bacterium]
NVRITGNLKYDLILEEKKKILLSQDSPAPSGISRPLLIWGNMRGKEEEAAIETYKKLKPDYPSLSCIYVPRHIEYTGVIEEKLKKNGIPYTFWPEPGSFMLVKKLGLLTQLYALADICIVGGGFQPCGGQNLLEAGIWGKPVVIGPHFFHFEEIISDLRDSLFVTPQNNIYNTIGYLLKNKENAKEKGRELAKRIEEKAGVLDKSVETILKCSALS